MGSYLAYIIVSLTILVDIGYIGVVRPSFRHVHAHKSRAKGHRNFKFGGNMFCRGCN